MWKKLHAAVARSIFASQNVKKNHGLGTLFEVGMWKTLHATVATSAFSTQNVQDTPCSDHSLKLGCARIARRCSGSTVASQNLKALTVWERFLKLGCGRIARRCGAKNIFKSKCAKPIILGPLFEVAMSKNCTPL